MAVGSTLRLDHHGGDTTAASAWLSLAARHGEGLAAARLAVRKDAHLKQRGKGSPRLAAPVVEASCDELWCLDSENHWWNMMV